MPVTRIKSSWESGVLVYRDNSGNEVARFDGVNRMIVPSIGGIFSRRFRRTIAEINAGSDLLAAMAGYGYRLIDAFAVAYGGAVGATTTVDLLGTVSTARKLVAFGQAALTQSALVRAGSSGGVLLADGASFIVNDVNTAVTVGKTGSDLTVATGVDFQLTYAIEKL
jgi:hypothetical protein